MIRNLEYQADLQMNRKAVDTVSEPDMMHMKQALKDATRQLSEAVDGKSPFPEANQINLRYSKASLSVEEAEYESAVNADNRRPGSVPKLEMEAHKLRIQMWTLRVKALNSQL